MWRVKRKKSKSKSKRERERLCPAGIPLSLRMPGWMQEGIARLRTGLLNRLESLDGGLRNWQRKVIFYVVVLLWCGTLFYMSARAVWKPPGASGALFVPGRWIAVCVDQAVLPAGTDTGRPRSTAGDFTDSGYLPLKTIKHETKRAAERGN